MEFPSRYDFFRVFFFSEFWGGPLTKMGGKVFIPLKQGFFLDSFGGFGPDLGHLR